MDLVDRNDLKYQYLGAFDEAMIHIISQKKKFERTLLSNSVKTTETKYSHSCATICFSYSTSTVQSFNGYGILARQENTSTYSVATICIRRIRTHRYESETPHPTRSVIRKRQQRMAHALPPGTDSSDFKMEKARTGETKNASNRKNRQVR